MAYQNALVSENVKTELQNLTSELLTAETVDVLNSNILVRLSLLTMTSPNQLFDLLLFVCSKMADETNLSSKLPVADRTREF